MARVKRAMMTRKRRNKILKMAKGYWGSKSKHYKMANQAMMKSLTYAYIGRRLKIDRKMLSELAVNDKAAFAQLVELAKGKLA